MGITSSSTRSGIGAMTNQMMTIICNMARDGYAPRAISLAAPLDAAAEAVWRVDWAVPACEAGRHVVTDRVTMSVLTPTRSDYIGESPAHPEELDARFLDLAWELGAWDVVRTERAPLPPDTDPLDPAHGIISHIVQPYRLDCEPGRPKQAADLDHILWAHVCAQHGWLVWSCKPSWPLEARPEPVKRRIMRDRTLEPDGSRSPRKWRPWEPVWIGADHQTVIRLGRAPHGNRNRRRHGQQPTDQ